MNTTATQSMQYQYQIENRNQSKMHMPKFFAYYNSVASAQSSISSITKHPISWNISWLTKMLTINSLWKGSIAKNGQKDHYKLSKIISSPEFAAHILIFHSTYGTNFYHYFDKTPLAPPGIKVLTHERAEGREYFAVLSARGYYVGPCLNHYRCYNMWIPTTNSTHITNTVDWFPHNMPMHIASATNILLATAKDLTEALCQSQRNPLIPPPDTQTRNVLVKLNEIFSNVTKPAESTHNNLPRVPMITIKTPADLPRVPPITTTGFIDMTATNRRIFRQNNKAKIYTKNIKATRNTEETNASYSTIALANASDLITTFCCSFGFNVDEMLEFLVVIGQVLIQS